jgi:hypothetical protein
MPYVANRFNRIPAIKKGVKRLTSTQNKWIQRTGRPRKDIPNVAEIVFCSLHFSKDCYDTDKLLKYGSYLKAPGRIIKKDACPDINLAFPLSTRQLARSRNSVTQGFTKRYGFLCIKLLPSTNEA